jgi:hypothetical protein
MSFFATTRLAVHSRPRERNSSGDNIATIAGPQTTQGLDNKFFAAMAGVILATVFLGFAHTYYLAGVFKAKLPSLIVHVHAVVFSSWILFLILQIVLVSAGRVGWHRRLGIFGGALAFTMVVFGFLAATQSFARGFSPPGSGISPTTFYAIPFCEMVTFLALFVAGFLTRYDAAAHKRLMLIATLELLGPAIGRWPLAIVHKVPPLVSLIIFLLILFVAVFDLWTRREVHRATVRGGSFVIVSQLVMFPIGQTALWHRFADCILKLWNATS